MPRNKKEGFVFSLMVSFLMCFFMGLYNVVLSSKVFNLNSILITLKEIPFRYIIAIILSYFIVSPFVLKVVNKIYNKNNLLKIVLIQIFTVILMAGCMSLLSLFTLDIPNNITNYLNILKRNYLFAFPLQILLVGPIVRYLFKKIYY